MIDDHFCTELKNVRMESLDASEKCDNFFYFFGFSKKIRVHGKFQEKTPPIKRQTAFIRNRRSTELMCCGLPAVRL